QVLSPSKSTEDRLSPGPLMRIGNDDVRDIPSLKTIYADAVPILYASSGIRRIVALSYILLWSWHEHITASAFRVEDPTRQVILLVDELESHLHPRWQRSILGALLGIAQALHPAATIQLIAATHSPLVLASAEPTFDLKTDAWFDLDLESGGKVVLHKREFVRRGDVSNWLTSEAFDLKESRSIEAEEAITKALDLLRKPKVTDDEVAAVDTLLKQSLGEIDRFWLRWSEFRDRREAAR
ncbi:MAG: AAA family ATPase, partial [Fimbriiglobus sp.]